MRPNRCGLTLKIHPVSVRRRAHTRWVTGEKVIKGTRYKGTESPKTCNREPCGNSEIGNSRKLSKPLQKDRGRRWALCAHRPPGRNENLHWGELGPQRRGSHDGDPLEQREIPWPLPSSCPPWPLTGIQLGALPREPLDIWGFAEQVKGTELRSAPKSKARQTGHFWRPSHWLAAHRQCPLLTFLMSSERKPWAYFTDGGRFTHRGCFTVCDKGHSVGCWTDPYP